MHTIILQKENNLLKTILNKGINIEHVMPDKESTDGAIGGSPLHSRGCGFAWSKSELLLDWWAVAIRCSLRQYAWGKE